MAKKRRKYEFRPDPKGVNLLKVLHLTQQQRRVLLKWTLYGVLWLLALVVQDTMMSRVRVSGATTDLVVCVMILVGVFEGIEEGGMFALISSLIYYFSGSAPGTFTIALVTVLTVGACVFRQSYWRRGFTSTVLCAGLALILYEMLVFLIGVFMNLTIWSRAGVFFLTGALSTAVLLPLYPLVRAIGKIGGETWKE
ncbi:MAG: hypothetical protein IJX69_03440 [Oscillospiraceae bacterium]|nr:hypothetical protein [Oscillospiraceae bacterium]